MEKPLYQMALFIAMTVLFPRGQTVAARRNHSLCPLGWDRLQEGGGPCALFKK
jgi:hypothetical protein